MRWVLYTATLVLLTLSLVHEADAKKHNKTRNNSWKKKNHHGADDVKNGTDHSQHDVRLVVIRESIAALGLLLCFAGSRIIKVTMFIGGFIVMFAFAYLTLPSIVDNQTCCGPNGHWWARILVCLLLGLLGGTLTMLVYYVGIFAVGGIFGMICALVALSTPLAEEEFFGTAMAVGLFYGGCIILGGLLALLFSTIAVAVASSIGGAYAVFYGIDYFAKTNFSGGIEVLLVQIQDYIRDEFGMGSNHGHHPDFFRQYTLKDIAIFGFFVILAMMGCVFQLYMASSDNKLKKMKEKDSSCKDKKCNCNDKNQEYLMEYLKTMQGSRSTISHDALLKNQHLK